MNEQTGIFLTDEEVLILADILHYYAISANHYWESEEEVTIEKVLGRAVEILIKNEKEQTK